MKGVIISQGKYGATQQYSNWLAEELQLPQLVPGKVDAAALTATDYVVIGSSVYVGKLVLSNWLKKHADLLQAKKVFLFIVCATPPSEAEKLEVIRQQNVPPELLNQCAVHFLHGRIIKKQLSWKDNFMLRIGAMLQKDPVAKKKMLQDFDGVRKENIIPLVKDIMLYNQEENTSVYTKGDRAFELVS
jgi:menaquinone-dependent protoporphyrinogen IX oxidase